MEHPPPESLPPHSDLDSASQEYLSELLSDFVELRARISAIRRQNGNQEETENLQPLAEIAIRRVRELRWLLEASTDLRGK